MGRRSPRSVKLKKDAMRLTDRTTQTVDVVIAGGGFAGLALGLALTHELPGISVTVIDRSGSGATRPDSRASALSAGSRRLLEAIDIWPQIASVAQPVTRIDITDSPLTSGVRPVLLSYDNRVEGETPATYIVPNAPLLEALSSAARAHPDVTLHDGAADGYSDEGARVVVNLKGGGHISGRLLVAADGRRSALRDAAGIKIVGWAYPQMGIVATVAHTRPHGGVAVQHFLPAGPFAILPITGNRSCVTWTEDAAEARRILTLDDEGFLDELDRRFGGKLGAISLAGPRQSWPLDMHLARSYVAPRFALLGDAAHGVHPIAGQGLNLALRDAAALAEVVADAMRLGLDPGNAESLARYERWRRFDSGISALTYDGLNRLFSRDGVLIRAVRDLGLDAVDRVPDLKRRLVGEAAGLSGDLPRLMRR